MAKSQKRNSREPKKAKTAVKKPPATASVFNDSRQALKKKLIAAVGS